MGKRKNGEGSYGTKKIKGVEYRYYRDTDGKYTYGKTAKELKEKLNKKNALEKEAQQSDVKTNRTYIFSDYCMLWLKSVASDITDGTYDDYESIIKCRIKEFKDYDIGNKQIKSLTEMMLNGYLSALGKKYSRGSIDKVWTVIKQVVNYGMDEGDIPQLNLSKVKKPREEDVAVKKKEIPFITMDDMEKLYQESFRKTSRGTDLYGNAARVIVFIMYSGVRIGEAIGLTWKYVSNDFESVRIAKSSRKVVSRDENRDAIIGDDGNRVYKRIQKTTKTENGIRSIPLPDRAIEALKYFYNAYPHNPDDHVFVTSNTTPFDKRGLERTLERMLKRSDCECKEYTPHALRHGYGSILISKGVDIKIVSELLGHSDVAFTYNVYIGILKADKINAIKNVFNT